MLYLSSFLVTFPVSMSPCPHLFCFCCLFLHPLCLASSALCTLLCAWNMFLPVACGVACLSRVFPTSPVPLLLSLVFSRPCGQALERQKEYFDCIRNERDELRDELADIKEKAKAGEVGPQSQTKRKTKVTFWPKNLFFSPTFPFHWKPLNCLKPAAMFYFYFFVFSLFSWYFPVPSALHGFVVYRW